ncbi:hypothetical protein DD595_25360, partial [Enterobacter cloacae complex sp. 4DZ3-17B2]
PEDMINSKRGVSSKLCGKLQTSHKTKIFKVVLCWHISQAELSCLETLPYIDVMHLNVLCASMKIGFLANADAL